MRANCICSIWNHANEKKPVIFHPEKNGWILRDNKFTPNWFIGELTPTLQDMLAPEEEIDSEDDEDTTILKTYHKQFEFCAVNAMLPPLVKELDRGKKLHTCIWWNHPPSTNQPYYDN
ncbi:hypothetical protein OUZ56_005548 [Daphnia magna]|uniref:Uncharacterized protein n=1 Tax=Daphnia magna TaxID=35525 RepID=A0ABQ9YT64_9CRUS|nr:hypothetical protein OUZ56_005548 [Daphnia magna]